jgi:putative ABC transport system permease protein
LTEADVEPQRLSAARVVPGLAVTVAAVGVTVLLRSLHTAPAAMPVSYVAVLLWMVAVALLGPLLTRVALTLVSGPLRRFPVAGFLAVENARANARRVASVVTPLTLLLGMAVTILFVSDTIDHAARTQVRQGVTAGHVVTAQGPGVPGPAARALRGTPGVRAVTEMLPTTVWLGHHKHAAEGVTTTGVSETIDPGVTSGSLARFRVGTVALSDTAVGDRHIGDTVQLTLGDGSPIRARLVAVYSRNLGFGDVLLPDETVARHVDDPLAAAVLVNGITSSDEISSHLTGYAGLTVGSKADYEALEASRQHVNTEVNVIFMALILGFTAIAVINTLAISIADRSRELSLMRLAGATASQVVRTLVCELGLAIGIAVALGTAAAWLTLTGFSDGMVGSGTPAFVPTTYAVLCAVALALGLVGTLLPARLVLVRHPYDDVTRS